MSEHENDGWIEVFAPATVANLGPGYDVLGLALEGLGDVVSARKTEAPGGGVSRVVLREIVGAELEIADDNTACVAARGVLELLGVDWGVELKLRKGLPLGSGLGSSGASAAAAAEAVNQLAGAPLLASEMIDVCAEAERAACGAAHRDNVAPALLGGVVLVRPGGGVTRIQTRLPLALALLTPPSPLPTRLARETIPAAIPLVEVVENSALLATLVYALATDDRVLLREGIADRIAEPRRAHLISGFEEVKQAALAAGALGSSISGAGPTIFALCADLKSAEVVGDAMAAVLKDKGDRAHLWVRRIAAEGARRCNAEG